MISAPIWAQPFSSNCLRISSCKSTSELLTASVLRITSASSGLQRSRKLLRRGRGLLNGDFFSLSTRASGTVSILMAPAPAAGLASPPLPPPWPLEPFLFGSNPNRSPPKPISNWSRSCGGLGCYCSWAGTGVALYDPVLSRNPRPWEIWFLPSFPALDSDSDASSPCWAATARAVARRGLPPRGPEREALSAVLALAAIKRSQLLVLLPHPLVSDGISGGIVMGSWPRWRRRLRPALPRRRRWASTRRHGASSGSRWARCTARCGAWRRTRPSSSWRMSRRCAFGALSWTERLRGIGCGVGYPQKPPSPSELSSAIYYAEWRCWKYLWFI